ncbi:hypothetical protein BC332_02442 [Capsicum chinense]|nr:hypothetical protein BC332_02442 [Capsicum chinense]
MNNHMLKLCPYRHNRPNVGVKEKDSQTKLAFLPSSTDEKGGALGTWTFDQERSRKALTQMIVVDELSFSFVEKEDVPTRWNSTYLMLETAQNFELAFERYSFYDNGFLDYLRTSPCEDGSKAGSFVSEDWKNVRTTKFYESFDKVLYGKWIVSKEEYSVFGMETKANPETQALAALSCLTGDFVLQAWR